MNRALDLVPKQEKPEPTGQERDRGSRADEAAYTIYGAETDPTEPYGDFTANWWALTRQGGTVKEAGNYPNISFGTANNTVFTDRNSELGQLIGGNTDSNFSILPLRGIIPTAQIVVTVSK